MTAPDHTVPESSDGWTPLQQAYVAKLYASYEANLRFLAEYFPAVFDTVMASALPAPFEVGPNAEVLIYQGQNVGGYRDFTDLGRLLHDQFRGAGQANRIWVEAPYFEKVGVITLHGRNPDFFRPVEPAFRAELVERFIECCPAAADRHARPYFGERVLPLVLVFGSGFGWHLDRLVDDYRIHNLLIVDTDVARLNLSLFFVDYVALYQRFAATGRSLSIALHDDIELLSASVLSTVQRHAPPYVVQGAALYFHDYDSERAWSLWGKISEGIGKLYRGWGFFDDEILGLRHAVENALARRPTYIGGACVPDDAVAIVCGAGPSLDVLLPVLHECRERVVVISCGTALSALANAGIDPDFHVEIERTAATYRMLDTPATRAVLARVPLLASAIMYPEVFDLSCKPAMFLKDIDFGSNMLDFGQRLPRVRTNPTCTNGGIDLALKLGFQTVFLFGVDLGFHEGGRHHSSNSIYYNGTATAGYLAGVVQGTHGLHRTGRPIAGNFGGEILSTDQLIYSRDVIQVSIADFPRVDVINPNDGARIAGARPVPPGQVVVEGSAASRAAALEAISYAFLPGVVDDMSANISDLLAQVDAVIADLQALFDRPLGQRSDLFDRLADMHAYFFHPRHQEAQVFPLMRGSMQHMGRFAWDCFALMKDDRELLDFGRFAFDLFIRFLRQGRENIVALQTLARTGRIPDSVQD